MAGYSKDDFEDPVEDYDFSNSGDVRSLIEQMGRAGGFTATKLFQAREILKNAIDKSGDGQDFLNWLSFPACLCATGTRGFFVEAIKRKAFNVIVTTCGTLDHDIARTFRDYFHGDFELDDIALGEEGLNRLGNVIVPNECYGEIIEQVLQPWLNEIELERSKENQYPWQGFGSVELCWAIGDRIEDESSLLYWVAKHRIPMVIPGITDGSVGSQLFMYRQKNDSFFIDVLADEQTLSDLTWTAKESHGLMVGGGISKHHVIWWNQYRNGMDSAVSITTAHEHDGSLSGARLREAVSWGKIHPQAPQIVLEGEASMILPILGADLFSD